ncbi:sugar-binding transcriptional regulator [Nitratireductor sp. GISD-1A_MAKvit]|uniref:sugar-binding transcriptional regulator n=1 Tax=Nitratireductor sp. GISD-1A_MAKvit TaxID=3234198 RepID=UPI00346693C6
MPRPPRNEATVIKIAQMRYEQGLSQSEIAEKLGVSVATVSRHLQIAMDHGIVEIRVAENLHRDTSLEKELSQAFHLRDAVVVINKYGASETSRVLGSACARFLSQNMHRGDIIGVSNGETVASVAAEMRRAKSRDHQVVTLIGGVGKAEEPTHTAQICRAFADAIDAKARILPLPAVVESSDIALTLRSTDAFQDINSLYSSMSMALVGIGSLHAASSSVRDGLFTRQQFADIEKQGGVGTICARFYDGEGRALKSGLEERTLSIFLDQFVQIPMRVGVAYGESKVAAIDAAVRGKLVNVVATDETTARALLRDAY